MKRLNKLKLNAFIEYMTWIFIELNKKKKMKNRFENLYFLLWLLSGKYLII